MADTTDTAALTQRDKDRLGFVTDDDTGGYYVAECEECGQIFPSQTCDGAEQIADSGDYGDCYCPHCGFIDPLECDNANLVWNVQQLKIVNLTKQLEAERQRAADLVLHINTQANMLEKAESELAALKGEQVPIAYLTRHMGCRAPDDCEEYLEVSDKDDVSGNGEPAIPVFTGPQKPVVLDLNYFDEHFDRLLDEKDDDIEIGQLGARNYEALHIAIHQSIKAAIEAAGGIVKDGE